MPNGSYEIRYVMKRIGAAGSLVLLAGSASAGEGDALRILSSQAFVHDDNVFRLADGIDPVIDGRVRQRHDIVSNTTLAATFDRSYGRQRVRAGLGVTRYAWQTFDHLDHDARRLNANWDWALGKLWRGTLGAEESQALRSFSDSGNTARSVNTLRRYTFDAERLLHPAWAVGGGAGRVESRYNDAVSARSEYDENAVELNLSYRPRVPNRIVLSARLRSGEYPGRDDTPDQITQYEQLDLHLRGDWEITAHSRMSGYLGHSSRDYPGLAQKDFSGLTGRLRYDWTPTGKLALGLIARREIGALEDIVDNFVVTDAIAIEPTWRASAKIDVSARAEALRRDYAGTPQRGIEVDRDDRLRRWSVGAHWRPLIGLELRAEVGRESRSASSAAPAYVAHTSTLSVRYLF